MHHQHVGHLEYGRHVRAAATVLETSVHMLVMLCQSNMHAGDEISSKEELSAPLLLAPQLVIAKHES